MRVAEEFRGYTGVARVFAAELEGVFCLSSRSNTRKRYLVGQWRSCLRVLASVGIETNKKRILKPHPSLADDLREHSRLPASLRRNYWKCDVLGMTEMLIMIDIHFCRVFTFYKQIFNALPTRQTT